VPSDLDSFDLGLTDKDLDRVFESPCDFWHFAANTSLAPVATGALAETNVEGTRRTLNAFRQHAKPGSRYFHVSTAYVCGLTPGPVAEDWHDPAPPSQFRTYYEWTKREAEHLVRHAVEEDGIHAIVVRLGQIVGSSATGATTSDYGMYDVIRVVHRLGRRQSVSELRLAGSARATLHLVPIDACIAWLWALAESYVRPAIDQQSPVAHVVDLTDVPVTSVTEAVTRHLGVELRVVDRKEFDTQPRTLPERLLAARMTYLGEYLGEPLVFERAKLDGLLGQDRPAVDSSVLDLLVGTYVAGLNALGTEG